jgi:PEP-CTERM motif-containing protein
MDWRRREFHMRTKSWIQIGATAVIFALAEAAAFAVPTTLTLTGPIAGNTVGPQSTSNPCVIAATQCQQPAGFGFNNFTSSGAISSYNMFSTTPTATVADGVQGTPYTVAQLTGAGLSSFVIAIDVNTTAAAGETLQLFTVTDTTTNTVLYQYVGPTVIGGVANNGNGFADWTLGTVSLAGLPSTDGILFHAVWNNASDGGESFFLVAAGRLPPTSVPEPGTAALLGLGLGVLRLFKTLRGRRVLV